MDVVVNKTDMPQYRQEIGFVGTSTKDLLDHLVNGLTATKVIIEEGDIAAGIDELAKAINEVGRQAEVAKKEQEALKLKAVEVLKMCVDDRNDREIRDRRQQHRYAVKYSNRRR